MTYTVKLTQDDKNDREITLHNLSAVWGFLCGAIPRYKTIYPTIARFKIWWVTARKRQRFTKTVDGIMFEIMP